MITLSLGKLKPGMVLAEPAYNFQGVLLLDTGSVLTEKNIRIMKSWGVTKVSVEGKSESKKSGGVESENQSRREIRNGLEKKFSDVMGDPVMMEIMRVAGNVMEERSYMRENENEKKAR